MPLISKGVALSRDQSCEAIYGMSYDEWKAKFQREATPEQIAAMKQGCIWLLIFWCSPQVYSRRFVFVPNEGCVSLWMIRALP